MRIDLGSGAARIGRTDEPRIPRWVHPILEVPLELKLLGANLIIVGAALLLMLGPVQLQPSRLTDAYIVVAVLMLGAAVNVALVRLAPTQVYRTGREVGFSGAAWREGADVRGSRPRARATLENYQWDVGHSSGRPKAN